VRATLVVCALATGCGGRGNSAPIEQRDGSAAAHVVEAAAVAAPAEIAARPLGVPELAAFAWRTRTGHAPYLAARKAEDRGDWAAVAASCKQALAADAGHLDAAWLYAIALAKLGKLGEVLEPLYTAVAGDFGKYGDASLEHPALAAFVASPAGAAWKKRIEQDRALYVAALGRAMLVAGGGKLYAYDATGPRFYRLTSSGSVLGAMRIASAQRIVYVARLRLAKKDWHLGVGMIDARGRTLAAVDAGSRGPLTVAYSSSKATAGPWLATSRKGPWRRIDDTGALVALPANATRPPGAWLEVFKRSARLHALPAGVIADWDDHGLASAIRIGKSNRVVTVASPGLIDGNTAVWSPDRSQLAFAAQLDEQCAPGAVNAAAFIADAATGSTRELERAAGGLAVAWVSDRQLAIAGDHGVSIVDLAGGAATPLAGADQLAIPRHRPRCTPPEPSDDNPPDEDPSDSPDLSKN
jgi:hypothetical protein